MSERFVWNLEAQPVIPPPPTGVAGQPLAQNPLDAFLGFGILRPFQRDEKNDFANGGGIELVKSAIGQILGTRSNSEIMRGELPWRPEFGSKLELLLHRKGPNSLQLARAFVQEAIRRWEPRVSITRVTPEFKDRTLSVRVAFEIISENTPGNRVILGGEIVVPIGG